MAQKVQVDIVSDVSGEVGAHEVTFGWLGNGYEIDLTESERKGLEDFLATYVEKARKVSSRRGRPKSTTAKATAPTASAAVSGGSGLTKEQRQEVRALAASHGRPLNERGRLPALAITAWQMSKSSDPAEQAKVAEILSHLAA